MTEEKWTALADRDEVFEFLDGLRASGRTNMLGAGPYIVKRFPDLSPRQARKALRDWILTFEERHSEGAGQ